MKVDPGARIPAADVDVAATRSDGWNRAGSLKLAVPAALMLLLAAAVLLRFVTRSHLWLDEALSVNIARLPLGRLHTALRQDGSPPLYYVLLHGWIRIFGSTDVAVRALSGVIGVLTLPVAWLCGRRIARTRDERVWLPWLAVLVIGSSPYAIRFATEARMYGLEILLVPVGYLALRSALDRPRPANLLAVAAVTAALLYTQYWALYLVAVVVALMLGSIWVHRGHTAARAAQSALAAVGAGCAAFIPWIPTFAFQVRHTGTPWGRAVLPPTAAKDTFLDFAGSNTTEGWTLVLPLLLLALLAVFGRPIDGNRIEIDLRTRPRVRWEALVAFGTLAVGLSAAYVAGAAYQSRYGAIMFGLFTLVVAFGVLTFTRPLLRVGALALVVALGLVGGVRNAREDRTQAAASARYIASGAQPHDVVAYCPDQTGPAVSRLLPAGRQLDQVVFPTFARPERVNWIDYRRRNDMADAASFVRRLLARAATHDLWYVYTANTVYGTRCEDMLAPLAAARPMQALVAPNGAKYFEYMGLARFPAPH
jgi:hypothetical protein